MELKRFVKVDANGNDLPNDAPTWPAFRSLATGVIWAVDELARMSHAEATAAAATTDVAGGFGRLATLAEFEADVVDRERAEPAINDEVRYLAPGFDAGAFWTSSPDVSAPDYAWFVLLNYGGVNLFSRDDRLRVRVVRSAVPSQ